MNKQERPEEWDWREDFVLWVMRRVGTRMFLSPYWLTPDNVTSFKLIATLVALVLAIAGCSLWLIVVCVAVGVLSDMFDGPVARVLKFRGLTPPPIFLSKWLPFLKGGPFDHTTDKVAIITGLGILVALGYPILPVLSLCLWSIAKIVATCHGAWLTGLNYRDLGRLVIRREPTEGFRERLTAYLAAMIDPVYVGKVELNIQLAGLLTGFAWLIWPHNWLINLGWLISGLAFHPGYASYSAHMHRFLEHHGATFRPGSYVCYAWLPLAECERNRLPLPRALTNFLMFLARYRVKKPT